jgi:hypothetical protein
MAIKKLKICKIDDVTRWRREEEEGGGGGGKENEE